jgi:hypothetical protein
MNGRWWWYIFLPDSDDAHIARSILEGCVTECGITLVAGWSWSTSRLMHPICETCQRLLDRIPAPGRPNG